MKANAGDSKGALAHAPSVGVDTSGPAKRVSPVNEDWGKLALRPPRPLSNDASSGTFHYSLGFFRTPLWGGKFLKKESTGVRAQPRVTSTEILVLEEVDVGQYTEADSLVLTARALVRLVATLSKSESGA